MSKKIKCKNCGTDFIPTLGAAKPACPQCQTPAPMATARASFATGEPIQLPATASGSNDFDIQWMPPGPQNIVCHVEGEPRRLEFTVKPAHAAAFHSMLQQYRAAAAGGEEDFPYIDFNHEDGRASGRPTEMYWGGEDPKKGGIRLKGKWTASGKSGVSGEAPEFTRFSPEWFFNDDGEPIAIGTNLGGLVNRAAFTKIASVASAAATKNQKNTMTSEEFKTLLAEALKPITSDITQLKAQGKAPEKTDPANGEDDAITKAIAKAVDPVMKKLTEMETAAATTLKAQAKAAVQVHVKRGAIAPADAESIEFWETAYLANASKAEGQLTKLPGKTSGRIIIGNGDSRTATASAVELSPQETELLAKAKAYRETNKACASDADAMAAVLRTAEGNALYAQILTSGAGAKRNDVRVGR